MAESTEDAIAVNLALWDERAPAHAASPGYAVARFVEDATFLSEVVRFDLPRLGDLSGLRGVHLQCHIGTDTISLARLGARMTGLDFSPAALEEARRLAHLTGADVSFVQADVRRALDVLPAGAFDLVFTGIGALCWVPRVDEWAKIVASLLGPGGRLFLRDGHPVLQAVDYSRPDELLVLDAPYFEPQRPMIWEGEGTYVETDVTFVHTQSREWNHGLGEIVTALLDHGLVLTQLVEHDSVPWQALSHGMERDSNGEWRLTERPERLPMSYTIQAVKPRLSA